MFNDSKLEERLLKNDFKILKANCSKRLLPYVRKLELVGIKNLRGQISDKKALVETKKIRQKLGLSNNDIINLEGSLLGKEKMGLVSGKVLKPVTNKKQQKKESIFGAPVMGLVNSKMLGNKKPLIQSNKKMRKDLFGGGTNLFGGSKANKKKLFSSSDLGLVHKRNSHDKSLGLLREGKSLFVFEKKQKKKRKNELGFNNKLGLM